MNSKHILFYQNNNINSQKFIDNLKKTNMFNLFNLVCIDNNEKLNIQITETPSIIVPGVQQQLSGLSAFNWLDAITKFGQTSCDIRVSKKIENSSDLTKTPLLMTVLNNNICKETGASGIIENDFKKISDDFAFIDDDDKNSKTMQKNIVNINDKEQFIITIPESHKKIDEKNQEERLRKLITNRKNQEISNKNTPQQLEQENHSQRGLQIQMQQRMQLEQGGLPTQVQQRMQLEQGNPYQGGLPTQVQQQKIAQFEQQKRMQLEQGNPYQEGLPTQVQQQKIAQFEQQKRMQLEQGNPYQGGLPTQVQQQKIAQFEQQKRMQLEQQKRMQLEQQKRMQLEQQKRMQLEQQNNANLHYLSQQYPPQQYPPQQYPPQQYPQQQYTQQQYPPQQYSQQQYPQQQYSQQQSSQNNNYKYTK